MADICALYIFYINNNYMQMSHICALYVYGRYMGDIWEIYGFNGQFLQPTYMGLTRDIYGTYKGHIRNLK